LLVIIILLIFFIILTIYFFSKKEKIVNVPYNYKEKSTIKPKKLNKAIINKIIYDLDKNVGNIYDNVILETFFENNAFGGSRIRVRPLNLFDVKTRVEFPKSLRETTDIGSKFSASVKVCQKTFTKTGLPKGQPYLLADKKTITLISK